MQLDDLLQPTANDIILKEAILTSKNNQDREYITELLPLIPLALWGAGAAWTAYDAYQAKKAYDRGEITGADLGKMVGTDIAITLAAGGVAKVVGKGWKFGKKLYKSKKAAKAAEQASVASAAQAVNKTVKSQVADVMPHSQAAVATTTSKLDNIVTPAAAGIVKVAKKADDVVDKVSSKAPDIIQKVKTKYKSAMPHSTVAATPVVTKATKKIVNKVDQKKIDDLHHKANVDNIKKNNKLNNISAPATAVTTKAVKTAVSKKRPWKKGETDIKTPNNKVTAPTVNLAGKGTEKIVKKKANDVKKKPKKWKLAGMGGASSMHDTNFSAWTDKYGYNK